MAITGIYICRLGYKKCVLFLNLKNCNRKWLCQLKGKKTTNYSKFEALAVTTCSEILSHSASKSTTSMLQTLLLFPSSGIMMLYAGYIQSILVVCN